MAFLWFYIRTKVGPGVALAELLRFVVVLVVLFWALMWFLALTDVL